MKDKLAIFFSAFCLVHCIVLPAGFLLSTSILGQFLFSERIHQGLFLVIAALALWALPQGLRQHHQPLPLLLALIGLSLLGTALFVPSLEGLFSVVGSLLLMAAHLRNFWLLKKAKPLCV